MARTLSQFIEEQTNPVDMNTNTDSLEKAYVESMIAFSTAKCYLEQAQLIDFADEIGIPSVTVIKESGDEGSATKQNIFQKAGNAVKNAWKWFIEMLKKIWGKIAGFFKGKKVEDAAQQYTSIFEQFKEKYPEVTDSMDSGDFYKFLKAKCPKATVNLTQAELTIWVKYNALVKAVKSTNELLDEILKQAVDADKEDKLVNITLTDDQKKRLKNIKFARYKDVQSKLGGGTKDNPGPGNANDDAVSKVSMGEILDAISDFKAEENLSTMCVDGQNKLRKLDDIFKKIEAYDNKKKADIDAAAAKKHTMSDISAIDSSNTSSGIAVKNNAETMKALQAFVNDLTTMEADVTKDMGPACDKFAKIAQEALKEATAKSEKGYDLNMESAYLV